MFQLCASVVHLPSAEANRAVTFHKHMIIHVQILARINTQDILQVFILQGSLSHLVIFVHL